MNNNISWWEEARFAKSVEWSLNMQFFEHRAGQKQGAKVKFFGKNSRQIKTLENFIFHFIYQSFFEQPTQQGDQW